MNERLDLTKILKDCPRGMELDCTMYEDVYFDYVDELNIIHCYVTHETHTTALRLNQGGKLNDDIKSKCVIFPKGKTTWEDFHRPFIDGDIVYNRLQDSIEIVIHDDDDCPCKICDVSKNNILWYNEGSLIAIVERDYRLATVEEKQKLFDAIKENGYKWNAETKTLEKLIVPMFKVGDIIQDKDTYKVKITEVNIEDEFYGYVSLIANGIGCISFNEQDNWELAVNYKFKVGDKIRHKINTREENIVTEIKDTHFILDGELALPFTSQDNWELVPNKFDPKTLKPFDKVLVRDINCNICWCIQFFESIHECNKNYPFMCLGGRLYSFCIPYNDETKHLIEKSEEAPKFYRYWEE